MRKEKQHWYVGEIIKAIFVGDTYEVISAISGKDKFKDDYPNSKPKRIVWFYEARNIDDGSICKFHKSQANDDGWFELVTPVEERLWDL
jgi:hypothetical protein